MKNQEPFNLTPEIRAADCWVAVAIGMAIIGWSLFLVWAANQ